MTNTHKKGPSCFRVWCQNLEVVDGEPVTGNLNNDISVNNA